VLIHEGIRPLHSLTQPDFRKNIYYEDVTGRRWNDRMLKSGCGREVMSLHVMNDCIYCPYCDEWFNKEQWVRPGEQTSNRADPIIFKQQPPK